MISWGDGPARAVITARTVYLLDGDVFPEALGETCLASILGIADILCGLEHLGLLSTAGYALVEDCPVGNRRFGRWPRADNRGDIGGGSG